MNKSHDEPADDQLAESHRAAETIARIQEVATETPHNDLVRAVQETREEASEEIEYDTDYSVPDHIKVYLLEDGNAVVRYDDPDHIKTAVAAGNDVVDIINNVSQAYAHVCENGGADN